MNHSPSAPAAGASRRKKLVIGGAIAAALAVYAATNTDDRDHAAEVQTTVMRTIAGTDTPEAACAAGYDWACHVTDTTAVGAAVTVHTDLPDHDTRTAHALAAAYLYGHPGLKDILVVSRDGHSFGVVDRSQVPGR